MNPKKNILIISSICADDSVVKSVAEQFSSYHQNYNVIIIDENQYGSKSRAERSNAASERYTQKIPVLYRNIKGIKQKFSRANFSVGDGHLLNKGLRGKTKRIYNAILRFNPDVILVTTKEGFHESIVAKRRMHFPNPIVVLMNLFSLDRSFYSPYADAYIVENIDMKNKITSLGFPSNKIFVLGLPIVENMPSVDFIVKKKAHLGLNMNPTIYLSGGKVGSREMFPVFQLLLDQGNMINIIADCGKNRMLHSDILKLIDEKKVQNVKVYLNTDGKVENTLIAADCVMTVFDSELIYRSFLLNIPVIAYAPDNASEEADLEYLASKSLIYYAHDYNFAIIGLYNILQTNLGKQLAESASVRTSANGLSEICELLANYKERTEETL